MSRHKQRGLFVVIIAMALGLMACGLNGVVSPGDDAVVGVPADTPASGVGLANPAAVYCQGLGYTMEARESAEGQDAACIFPDGTECGQWDFMFGRCGQQWSYCAQQGHTLESGPDGAACVFADGSSCMEIDFFDGACGPAAPADASAPELSAIAVEGISFSYDGSLASEVMAETVPAFDYMGGGDVIPAHIEFALAGYPLADTFHKPRILVYPVADFKASSERAAEIIAGQRQFLAERPDVEPGTGFNAPGIPLLPLFNAGQMLRAHIAYLDFQNGTGVRFLTQYAQAYLPINNHELFYTYQGITDDGAYYVAAILPVSSPILPADEMQIPGGDFETFANTFDTYIGDVEGQLDAQDPADFTPDLALLDAMVQSIAVNPAP